MAASAARRISGSSLRWHGADRVLVAIAADHGGAGAVGHASPRCAERSPERRRSPQDAAAAPVRARRAAFCREGSATPPRFNFGGPGSSGQRANGRVRLPLSRCGRRRELLRRILGAAGCRSPVRVSGDAGSSAAGGLSVVVRGRSWARPSRCPPRLRRAWGGAAAGLFPIDVDRGHVPAGLFHGFHRDLVAEGEVGGLDLVAALEELGFVVALEIQHALVAEFDADATSASNTLSVPRKLGMRLCGLGCPSCCSCRCGRDGNPAACAARVLATGIARRQDSRAG